MTEENFTYYAHERMMDLYYNHEHEVGSELYKTDPALYQGLEQTNCITYVANCMDYAFRRLGQPDAARQVWRHIIRGVDLASYLVQVHNWECIYINPDVRHPYDEDSEHPFSYRIVKRRCQYYSLPVFATAINYNPTVETELGRVYSPEQQTVQQLDDINKLANVKFGFGLSRGGYHTWAFSEGLVYEVHWMGIGDDLYERSSVLDFSWLSSVIVVPPEAAQLLRAENINRCLR